MAGTRFPFLDNSGPIAFAHRGGAAERMENTWASFSHALELGYRYMETDVHATKDGVVVAFHDADLSRVSGRSDLIGDLTWAELSKVELNSGDAVPRLDELLSAWPDVRWNIDAKDDMVVVHLAETVKRCEAVERVCVTSFSDLRLDRVKRSIGPRLCTAMGPVGVGSLRLLSFLPSATRAVSSRTVLLPFRRFGAVQVPTGYKNVEIVNRRFVDTAHAAGVQVHVWTVDEEAEMIRLLDLGVDGLMTDRPTLLKEVIERGGGWPGTTVDGAQPT